MSFCNFPPHSFSHLWSCTVFLDLVSSASRLPIHPCPLHRLGLAQPSRQSFSFPVFATALHNIVRQDGFNLNPRTGAAAVRLATLEDGQFRQEMGDFWFGCRRALEQAQASRQEAEQEYEQLFEQEECQEEELSHGEAGATRLEAAPATEAAPEVAGVPKEEPEEDGHAEQEAGRRPRLSQPKPRRAEGAKRAGKLEGDKAGGQGDAQAAGPVGPSLEQPPSTAGSAPRPDRGHGRRRRRAARAAGRKAA